MEVTETQQQAAEETQNVRDASLYPTTNFYVKFNVNKFLPSNTAFHQLHKINKFKGYYKQAPAPKKRKEHLCPVLSE